MKLSDNIPLKLRKSLRGSFIYCGVCAVAGFAVLILSRKAGGFGEWYASHIFPVFPDTAGRVMSLLPFSVFETLVCALALLIALRIVYILALAVVPKWRGGIGKAALKALRALLVLVCTLFVMLSLTCAVNYSRDTFAELTGRQVTESSKEDLRALCELLIIDLNGLSDEMEADGIELFAGVDGLNGVKKEARESMKRLGRETRALAGFYPNPKPVHFSRFMSKLNLTGIYSPFTIEANYNADIPEYLIPFTMCHELAHLRGFIREDEAGFIAYLACRGSESWEFRYSGALNALSYALGAYYRDATIPEYSALKKTIPLRAAQDLSASSAYWAQFRGRASAMASRANDAYLKANAQADGVKSYGRMVDLLLAEYRSSMI